ncbi:MAG: BamA/TamA family outer membrane protein [Novosphingobium sp.]
MFVRTALVAALLLAKPAFAQNRDPDAELKALIPDSAVENPDSWAKAPSPAQAEKSAQEAAALPQLDPNSPLAEDGGIHLPWPDEQFTVPDLVSLEPDPDLAEALKASQSAPLPERVEGDVQQISRRLALVFPADPAVMPMRKDFAERFSSLSTIKRLSGEGEDNIAQLSARARTDNNLLLRMLRVYGYYDAEVTQTVSGIEPGATAAVLAPSVRFEISPGPRYRFGSITLGDLAGTGPQYPALRSAFGIQTGDPLDNDRIVVSQQKLDEALGEQGYAFAKLGEAELVADHRREEGDLSIPVTTGAQYRFGGVVSKLPDFLSSKHLEDIARFERGDLYKRSLVKDLRQAIVATGLVSSVVLEPRETVSPQNGEPGTLVLDAAIAKAPLRTIAGAIGYDSGEGFRLEASWEHRNLFPPEGMLRLRAVAGTKEQLAGVTLRRNNFRGRDQVLTFDVYGNLVKRTAYVAKTVAATATFEKLTTLIFQKPWVWSVGLEAVASNERPGNTAGIVVTPQTYYVLALPLRGAVDTSDNLLDPTHGFRAALRISPELSLSSGRKVGYARLQADASVYVPLGKAAVVAARVRFGSITGAAIGDIAPSRRFYAGGGGSVRGYGYQEIGPRDAQGLPSGGRSLSEFSLEARVKTGLFGSGLSVVPFIDGGTAEVESTPHFRDIRLGAGLGLRYQTGFGPIRVDVATPIGRRAGESVVAVYVSLGQAF